MRRTIALLFFALLTAPLLAGCLGGDAAVKTTDAKTPKKIAGTAPTAVPLCDYKFDGQFSQVCAEGPFKEKPFVRQIVKSKLDGVDIEVGYWLPDAPEGQKFPVIVMASPYYGNLGEPMAKKSGYLLMLISNYVQHGYAVAGLSVRGTGGSGGCMDLMGKKEVADLDQGITWIAEQPWSDGSLGMIGLSYDGSTPWSVAATGNKYLKTIVPISGVPDVYGLMFKNGSAESRGPFLLNMLYYAFAARVYIPDPQHPEAPIYAPEKTAEGLICPESWVGLGAAGYSGGVGDRDPLGWWAERNRKPLVAKNYHGSILSVQGLQDWNVDPSMVIPWVQQLNQSGVFTHQFLGQWDHSYPDTNIDTQGSLMQRWDWAEILLHWFDYWLKGETTVDLGPAVHVQDSTKQWRAEETFPPVDANWTTYHLATGARLASEPGPAGSMMLLPTPLVGEELGPNFRSMPNYKADFSTSPMTNDTRISGLPRLHVSVTPRGPTGHLAAWLMDVDAAGQETQIGRTQMNLWYYDGTEQRKTLTPGQPVVAKIEFQPLDALLKEGHRLLVRVWQYSDTDRLPALPPEPVDLNWGGTTKSTLELPLIERAPDTLFSPPKPTN